ncbi:MAG: hypothetical protein E7257_01580 [Lachnospiraceae bacterium]|nr:hypothetical protein [Lachnospiraceae bacterium]MBQ9936189.1 hypothetical protein [Lachnospiraceae bacterium]
MDKQIIDGYFFASSRDVKMAIKEKDAIEKIKDSINIQNTESVYDTYNKLVTKNYFVTPVGMSFLHDMRDYLKQFYGEEELKPIAVADRRTKVEDDVKLELNYKQLEKLKQENSRLNRIKQRLVIMVISMIIIIVGMLFIVVTNENLGYFNAEEKVLNKYASWQERLENWEEELIRREEALSK